MKLIPIPALLGAFALGRAATHAQDTPPLSPTTRRTTHSEPSSIVTLSDPIYGVQSESLIPKPVLHYTFTDGSTEDSSGNRINALNFGAVACADMFGNAKSAMCFNGASYLKAAAEKLPTGERTVSLWMKLNTVENRPAVLSYGGVSAPGTSFLAVINSPAFPNSISIFGHFGAIFARAQYSIPIINQWLHVAYTSDLGGRKIYLNGLLIGSDSQFMTNTYTLGRNLIVGGCIYADGKEPYQDQNVGYTNGALDDIRIYDRALTSTEIESIRLSFLGSGTSSPTASPSLIPSLQPVTASPTSGTPTVGPTVNYGGLIDTEKRERQARDQQLMNQVEQLNKTLNSRLSEKADQSEVGTLQNQVNTRISETAFQIATLSDQVLTLKSTLSGIQQSGGVLVPTQTQSGAMSGKSIPTPVLHYTFTDGSTQDSSGNRIDAVNYGAVPCADMFGNAKGAMCFNGASYLKAAAEKLPTGERTLSLWMNLNSVTPSPSILGYGGSGTAGTSFSASINSERYPNRISVASHGFIYLTTAQYTTFPVNQWAHLAYTSDISGSKIYFNGQLVGASSQFFTNTYTLGRNFYLGTTVHWNGLDSWQDGNGGYLTGALDDLRLYDYALTATEIESIRLSFLGSGTSSPTASPSTAPSLQPVTASPTPVSPTGVPTVNYGGLIDTEKQARVDGDQQLTNVIKQTNQTLNSKLSTKADQREVITLQNEVKTLKEQISLLNGVLEILDPKKAKEIQDTQKEILSTQTDQADQIKKLNDTVANQGEQIKYLTIFLIVLVCTVGGFAGIGFIYYLCRMPKTRETISHQDKNGGVNQAAVVARPLDKGEIL